MRVRNGWSGEIKPNVWAKVDVELEEEDLNRMLLDAGLCGAVLSVTDAFWLLETEGERLITGKLMLRHGLPADEGRVRIADLLAGQQRIYDRYRR